uniref:RING-type domain-containing protein n=1 Tax=Setaria digitata TaxID=48799 RepID=A0A915Q3J2_9BILA
MVCDWPYTGDNEILNDDAEERTEDESSSSPLTHLFVELTSLEELSFPTSSSTRIKYTCLDVSAHYLAVGSTSGTIYLFSRFASKYRNRISSVPIQVISIKDGSVIKLSISPNEKYLAAASRRGSLAIIALVDERSQSIHITELCWCNNSSEVYAGDTRGRISRTLIHNRNFFRSPTDIIFETDSEIVQFDLRDHCLLVSTLTRCCICNLKTYTCVQVGKRLRKGHFGAIFYSDKQKRKSLCEEADRTTSMSIKGCDELTVIFASRPNGRLWEANGCGVVYSTHQYRNLRAVRRFPVVSFKEDNLFDNMTNNDEVQTINFGLLTLINCRNNLFLMAKTNTTFCLIDPKDSQMILMSKVDCIDSISEYAVNDADLFLLSSETGSLRKLTLFTVEKAVEKLHWRQCYTQAAQLIYADYIARKNYNSFTTWNCEQLEDILSKIAFHHVKSQITDNILDALYKLIDKIKRSGSIEGKPKTTVHRLNSGIHRIVQAMQNSGYEDDFTFRAPSPLRIRSKSTLHTGIKNSWKRRSLPFNNGILKTSKDEIEFEDPEEHRKKLINEARILLLDAEKTPANKLIRNGSVESLRTLLDSSNTLILFDQQVTINDVTKDLVAAKRFQQLIGKHKSDGREQKPTAQIDFKTLFGRRDPLEMLEKCVESMPLTVNVNVAHLRTIRRTRRGARIVKGIKPSGRRNIMPEIKQKKSEFHEQISQQQIVRHGLTSTGNLNLNCNEILTRDENSKHSTKQSLEDNIRLLNKSYVVEKNFVTVQPIEVTWTVNGDDENDSIGMKSSEAAATLNDKDKRLMQSSEVTSAPKACHSGTKELDEKEKEEVYCRICGLHRIWHYVMMFGPKMSQLRVTVDQFAVGGVPIAFEQWKKLFEYRTALVRNNKYSSDNLCDDCAAFFEFDDQLKRQASSLREVVERIEKRSITRKCSKNFVQMAAKNWSGDLVYGVFFRNNSTVTKQPSSVQKGIVTSPHSEKIKVLRLEEYGKFSWLPAVKASQLLLCMRYCQGLSAVFELLKNSEELTSCLTLEDWQWLAVMKSYECNRFFDLMPKEVISDLLAELKISAVEDVGMISSTSFPYACGVFSNSKLLGGSLTISLDGNCACCTLPLKMRVTHNDGYITVFRCGHLYHQICLREANLSRCLRCEIEQRRRKQKQQQIESKSDAPNPSHSSAIKGSRHLPIQAIRTTLPSPQNVKIPQRT